MRHRTLSSIPGTPTPPCGWNTFVSPVEHAGADDNLFIIQYLPLYLTENARAWLEHLLVNSIYSWTDFKHIFMENFQGTYVRPRNS
jgi:hypothetical protein